MFDFLFGKRQSYKLLFLLGALLGALLFIGIYGVRILDFTNTGWLFYGDNDLRQHYIAWCNYRRDPWHFPIGLIDSLSYPFSMSVIYTDSIPLFAVIFKLFRGVLPVTFQYFGLFGILSFMLMGGISAVFLSRFTDILSVCIAGSGLFTISFPVIFRLYYHTALAAQWIVVLALTIWVFDREITSKRRKILIWSAMGFLCVAIHSYFLPMVGMVLAADMIMQFIRTRKTGKTVMQAAALPLSELAGYCIAGMLNLYILGGFYGGTSATGGGLGTFGANLNTFINPLDMSRIFKALPLYYDFQYEGFAYLGVGLIFLFAVVAMGMVFRMVRKVPEAAFHSDKLAGRMTIAVFCVSAAFATLPLISIGSKKIVWIPYPQIVEKVLGIFRSNGRLIWVAFYILAAAAIGFTAYTFRQDKVIAAVLVTTALVLHIMEGSGQFAEKYKYFSMDYPVVTMWDDPALMAMTDGKDEFIFLYTDNDITLYTAYYGYIHNMRQNNYYYARDIDDKVRGRIDEYKDELNRGIIRDGAVYVVSQDEYLQNQDFYDSLDAEKIYAYDHFIFTKKQGG